LYFNQNPQIISYYTATELPLALRLTCVNGGFEDAVNSTLNYTFLSSGNRVINGCATPADIVPINVNTTNNFNARATVISSLNVGFNQFDPTLNTAARGFIQTPTISPNGGNHAIKLNIGTGGRDVTTMRRNVTISPTDSTLDYEFSLLLQDSGHNQNQGNLRPFFRVNLIVNGVVVNTRCVRAEPNCIFNVSHANNLPISEDIFFSGWRCDQIDVTGIRDNTQDVNAILEFTIGDCGLGGHFGTVYIDNICNFECTTPAFGAVQTNQLVPDCNIFGIPPTPATYNVCGTFAPPVNATLTNMSIAISTNGGAFVTINNSNFTFVSANNPNTFCFNLNPVVFGVNPIGNTYQFQITANFGQTCNGITSNIANTTLSNIIIFDCCLPNVSLTSPVNNMNNLTTPTIPQSSFNIQRSDWIRATNVIGVGNNAFQIGVVYHAGNFVELNPGFEAVFGSQFATYPQGCTTTPSYVFRGSDLSNSNNTLDQIQEAQLIKIEKRFSIIPNPSSNSIEILMKNSTFNKVLITSIDGKTVFNKSIDNSESFQVDVSNYANGLYIVNVIDKDGQVYNQKLIKN
jgi:hypothetical protein